MVYRYPDVYIHQKTDWARQTSKLCQWGAFILSTLERRAWRKYIYLRARRKKGVSVRSWHQCRSQSQLLIGPGINADPNLNCSATVHVVQIVIKRQNTEGTILIAEWLTLIDRGLTLIDRGFNWYYNFKRTMRANKYNIRNLVTITNVHNVVVTGARVICKLRTSIGIDTVISHAHWYTPFEYWHCGGHPIVHALISGDWQLLATGSDVGVA
jgi:hypothetical protein